MVVHDVQAMGRGHGRSIPGQRRDVVQERRRNYSRLVPTKGTRNGSWRCRSCVIQYKHVPRVMCEGMEEKRSVLLAVIVFRVSWERIAS